MGKIDPYTIPERSGSGYPAPFDEACRGRHVKQIGDAAGLTQFGVLLVRLSPGAWSGQRHWHALEDEFVRVLEGEVVMVTDEGEQTLRPGDNVGFAAGVRNGHCLQNRTTRDALLLTVGSRVDTDHGEYPDIDMAFGLDPVTGYDGYRHKDGRPY
ncbi:MAG: cupin domain-containing protein [Myxococcales bacterium]|nr:cupin domain-containing protein [Myxococcales bacterium]